MSISSTRGTLLASPPLLVAPRFVALSLLPWVWRRTAGASRACLACFSWGCWLLSCARCKRAPWQRGARVCLTMNQRPLVISLAAASWPTQEKWCHRRRVRRIWSSKKYYSAFRQMADRSVGSIYAEVSDSAGDSLKPSIALSLSLSLSLRDTSRCESYQARAWSPRGSPGDRASIWKARGKVGCCCASCSKYAQWSIWSTFSSLMVLL